MWSADNEACSYHDDECFAAILNSPDGVRLVQDALCGHSLLGTSLNEHLVL